MTNEEAIKHVENMKKGIFLFQPDELYDTIISALKKDSKTGWIPLSERLPEVGIDMLICDMEGTIYLSHRSSFDYYFDEWGNKIKNIRAWMPLPAPYKESEVKNDGSKT